MRPAHLTLGTCKLSLEPLPGGTVVELTDYETDITWLSGSIFVIASGGGSSRVSHIALHDVSWKVDGDCISINGGLDPLVVSIQYRLAGHVKNPVRLEEKISITNPTDNRPDFNLIRVGPTWSPPKSWWVYWGYWRLMKLTRDFNRDSDIPKQPGEKLSSIKDRLEKWSKSGGEFPLKIDDDNNATGWIFCDGGKYSVLITEHNEDNNCELDIFTGSPHPIFIIGGARGITSGKKTTLIPGKGGWEEAIDVYLKYREAAQL